MLSTKKGTLPSHRLESESVGRKSYLAVHCVLGTRADRDRVRAVDGGKKEGEKHFQICQTRHLVHIERGKHTAELVNHPIFDSHDYSHD